MLLHKCAQHILFLLLITCRLPHLLLALIKHHLLDHTPRLTIQITQLAVLRCDLRDVDFWGRGDDVFPPLHLVGFVEVELEHFGAFGGGGERPG